MSSTSGTLSTQEIINSLSGEKKVEMFTLIKRYKTNQIPLNDFLALSHNILGPRLYTQWVSRFSPNQQLQNQFFTQTQNAPGSTSRSESPAAFGNSFMTPFFPKPIVPGEYAAFGSNNSSMPTFKSFQQDQSGDAADLSGAGNDVETELIAPSSGQLESTADVTQMDTNSLQDIIQYVGVDLKEEAENILRGHESFISTSYHVGEDMRSSYEYYLNVNSLKEHIQKHCKKNGLRAFHDDCFYVIAFAIKEKISRMIEKLSLISKHRVEFHRLRFKIRVENDPLKQVWVLEKHLKNLSSTSFSESELVARKESTLPFSSGLSMSLGSSLSQQQQQLNLSSPDISSQQSLSDLSGRAAKRIKKTAISNPAPSKEREDVAIKTRLTNVTALAQIGAPQKAWMSSASIAGNAPGSTMSATGAGSAFSTNTWKTNIPISFSTSSTDKDIAQHIAQRTISVQDVLFFMEKDPYLSKTKTYLSIIDSSK